MNIYNVYTNNMYTQKKPGDIFTQILVLYICSEFDVGYKFYTRIHDYILIEFY